MKHADIRLACCEANQQLPSTGLVDMTFGNISVLDPDAGVFAIKPSGVSYDDLAPELMVVLDLEGNVIDGELRPSSDTPTHRRLFREWGSRGVVSLVHTHSRNAVAFAQAARPIPCLGTTHADYFNGPVPVTRTMTPEEVGGDYEWDTGSVILEAFEGIDPIDVPAVLVRNHGPFAWGSSAPKALENARALEIVADMAARTLSLASDDTTLPPHLLHKHFSRKHGPTAYYGQANP